MREAIRILIVGNGFGGTYVLKDLGKFLRKNSGSPSAELSMVGEKNYFLFTPLLHEVATGGINPENIIEPIRKVLGHCLANLYLGHAESIDLDLRKVKVGNKLLDYDLLVLATGAQTNYYGIPGAEEHSFPLKSLDDAIKIKKHVIMQMEHASHVEDSEVMKKKLAFVIVGGGATGVELTAELMEMIKENFSGDYGSKLIKNASVRLIQMGPELVPQFGKKVRKKSLEVLRKKGIDVMLKTKVKEVGSSHVVLEGGDIIATETVIWVAGVKPGVPNFIQAVEKSPEGQIIVNECLQLKSHKEVFVLGDIAAFQPVEGTPPLPKLAQVAVKEARAVARNVHRMINGKTPEPFSYRHSGDFISLGRWMAIGEVLNFTIWGGITWWIWRTVYLSKLISLRKKVEVAIDWTINIFSKRDMSQM